MVGKQFLLSALTYMQKEHDHREFLPEYKEIASEFQNEEVLEVIQEFERGLTDKPV